MTREILEQLLRPWRQVADKADAFFDRVFVAHGAQMRCAPGCAGCCVAGLGVMLVEAIAIVDHLQRHPPGETSNPKGDGCALLRQERCLVYPARPMICRTHGLPIRDGEGVACCPLNFTAQLPPSAILDAERLTAMLGVADGIVRQALGGIAPARLPVAGLLARGAEALPGPARRLLDEP